VVSSVSLDDECGSSCHYGTYPRRDGNTTNNATRGVAIHAVFPDLPEFERRSGSDARGPPLVADCGFGGANHKEVN